MPQEKNRSQKGSLQGSFTFTITQNLHVLKKDARKNTKLTDQNSPLVPVYANLNDPSASETQELPQR